MNIRINIYLLGRVKKHPIVLFIKKFKNKYIVAWPAQLFLITPALGNSLKISTIFIGDRLF